MANATGSGTFAVRASAGERAAWSRQAESEGLSRQRISQILKGE
jgi:hypothetical protein